MGGNPAAQCLERFDSVVVKSEFHARQLGFDPKDCKIIPNGIRHSQFNCAGVERISNRFVYASDYSRGLQQLLEWFWPRLIKLVPDAELHIYYGMDLHKPEFQHRMKRLLNQPGIFEYGKRPVAEIAIAKCTAAFHLYFSKTTSETDCVSIRESAYVGCVPLLSTHHVFGERAGIHLPGDPEDEDDTLAAADLVAQLLNDSDRNLEIMSSLRQQLYETEAERSWDDQARVWTDTVVTRSIKSQKIKHKKKKNKRVKKNGSSSKSGRSDLDKIVKYEPGRIPRRIIQTWKTSEIEHLPSRIQGYVKEMIRANPGYLHQIFSDVDVEDFVYTRCAARWIALYEALPTVIQRLDLFRVLAVYEFGGFYFDMDMSVHTSLEPLLKFQAVFPEEVHSNTDKILRIADPPITNLLGNYAFGAQRRHPLLLRVLESMEAAVEDPASAGFERGMTMFKKVLYTTGPVMFTRAIINFQRDDTLPAGERDGIEILTASKENQFGTFGTHHIMHSWVYQGMHNPLL